MIEGHNFRIEIHAVDHCTQKCEYCSHAADIAKPMIYRPEHYVPIFEIMDAQSVNWDVITVVGGEPFVSHRLAELIKPLKRYTGCVEVMTNCFWLRSEKDIEKYDKVLRLIDHLTITLYHPILDKIGRKEFNRLLEIVSNKYGNLHISFFGQGKPVEAFSVLKFYDEPKSIINLDCCFRDCIQLMPEGYLMRCCGGRRVPNHKSHDFFEVDGHIDRSALLAWLWEPIIGLCSYCSIATDGVVFEPWRNQIN